MFPTPSRSQKLSYLVKSAYYAIASRLLPQNPWTHYHLAKTLLLRGDLTGAERAYRQVIERDPTIALASHELADILQQQQQWDEAAKAYRQAIEHDPSFFWSHHNLGDVLSQTKQWPEAAIAYRQALDIDATSSEAAKKLGRALMECDRREEAVEAYRTATQLQPNDFDSWYNLAGALRELDQLSEVAEIYLKTIEVDPTFPWFYYFMFWKTLDSQGKLNRAEILYREALDRHSDTIEVYVNLAESLTRQDKISEAIACHQDALTRKLNKHYPQLADATQTEAVTYQPNFIILGAQKAGTSSLYIYLSKHPKVVSAIRKEVEFWSWKFRRGLDWYFSHFPPRPLESEFLTGEACPGYLDFYETAERIHGVLPNVKLVVLLRNPIDRAVSHYHHWIRRHQETLPFDRACQEKIRELKETGSAWNLPSNYIARGIYVQFLKHWFNLFPREQFLIIKSEDFYQNPMQTLSEVERFLRLTPHSLSNYKKYNVGSYSPIDSETRQYLRDFYEPYNRELEDLLEMSFDWH